MKQIKHANISVFVPHVGCPCQCSFCNQNSITGVVKAPQAVDVRNAVISSGVAEKSMEQRKHTEIAFFGGSFTAIERAYMLSLLEEAEKCVVEYALKGIRVSTRPDCIDSEVLDVLKKHRVTSIELGAQSMDDEVLEANRRGHSSGEVIKAANRIKEAGLELGLQMMTGLYKDDPEKAMETAQKLISLKPATIRIYPTIVLEGTHLSELLENGEYAPPTLDEAVELCSRLVPMFEQAGVKVIKLGLHAEESLEMGMVAGPYHPAFSELVSSEIFIQKLEPELLQMLEKTGENCYNILVNAKNLSVAIGQKKSNVTRLRNLGLLVRFLPSDRVSNGFVIESGEIAQ